MLQASTSWPSSDQLNCVAPLDDSGDLFLAGLFPDFFEDSVGDATGAWDTSMAGASGASSGQTRGSTGFFPINDTYLPSLNDSSFFASTASSTEELQQRQTSTSPTHSAPYQSANGEQLHSMLPTPESSLAMPRNGSQKRRAADEGDSLPRTMSPPSTTSSDNPDRAFKRQRNTEAARRYRQRKVDRTAELEDALAAMTKERDELKLRLARSEAEAGVLKGLVGKGNQ